ncbi:MAG: DMT family transporter [Chromatiales bacterium]|nr:DMT family transporter [Chromatiales bacterium]
MDAPLRALSPTVRGMLLMLVATLSFTAMQTGVRIIAGDPANMVPAVELAFFRNLFGVVALLPLLMRSGTAVLKTHRLGLHFVRAACQSVGMVCFFMALTLIPLAEITALSFSAPLFATVFAILVLGERVRVRRISALVIGFIGVMVALQPGAQALSLGALLVLASSLSWAIAMTMIKSLSRSDSAVTITLYAGLFMAPITLVPALFVWVNPTLTQLAWLLGVGVLGSIGHVAFAQAFKMAEMSAVLPLDFLRLVWASAVGFWFFAEVPTWASLAGGLTIFASASYIAFREAKLNRTATV